jgi:hypothetical protein
MTMILLMVMMMLYGPRIFDSSNSESSVDLRVAVESITLAHDCSPLRSVT